MICSPAWEKYLCSPAWEGALKGVWVALSHPHLNWAAPRIDLLVDSYLMICQCSCISCWNIIKALFLLDVDHQRGLTSTIWLSSNGAADRTRPWLNSWKVTFKGFISQFGRDSLEPGWHDFEKLSDRPVRVRQAGHNEDGRQQLETPCLTHRPCWRRPQSSWGPQRGPSSPLATASQLGWKRSAAGAQIFS